MSDNTALKRGRRARFKLAATARDVCTHSAYESARTRNFYEANTQLLPRVSKVSGGRAGFIPSRLEHTFNVATLICREKLRESQRKRGKCREVTRGSPLFGGVRDKGYLFLPTFFKNIYLFAHSSDVREEQSLGRCLKIIKYFLTLSRACC